MKKLLLSIAAVSLMTGCASSIETKQDPAPQFVKHQYSYLIYGDDVHEDYHSFTELLGDIYHEYHYEKILLPKFDQINADKRSLKVNLKYRLSANLSNGTVTVEVLDGETTRCDIDRDIYLNNGGFKVQCEGEDKSSAIISAREVNISEVGEMEIFPGLKLKFLVVPFEQHVGKS